MGRHHALSPRCTHISSQVYIVKVSMYESRLHLSALVRPLRVALPSSVHQTVQFLSDKEYSKSHLTELRDKFILKLKSKIESLTGEKDGVYETKHKDDKRIKGYKANGAFKKKTSFIVHLFKIK
mgnify:CR=1 FL=1